MQVKLLFITSLYFRQTAEDTLRAMELPCETEVVTYTDFTQIVEVYNANIDRFDACFVSGIGAKGAIEMAVPNIKKPLIPFQVNVNALYRYILRLAVEKQSLDFSRIVIDFLIPLQKHCTVSGFLALDNVDIIHTRTLEWMQHNGPDKIEAHIISRIHDLWDRGAIDLVICQYSSIVPVLKELGIPCHCPYLSEGYLKPLVDEVLLKLELLRLHDNHPAIVQIFPSHYGNISKEEISTLLHHVQEYTHANLIECVIQSSGSCCTILTSMQILRFLTNDFQICRLASHLESVLDFPVAIGYGIGTTLSHAMNNVQIASREAKLLGKSFVVDSNGSLIGPLNTENRMLISHTTLPDVSDIAKRCSLSSMTIQKLLNILRTNGSDKITTQDLAQKLHTTIRNANRIMLNLCKGGVAKPVYTQTSHSRGRPIQVYALDLGIPLS